VGRSPRSSAASAIVPVPADRDARIHFGLQRARLHARALDRELETLARGNYRSAGQWASRAAVPIVRAQCITRYLAVTADRPAVTAEEHGWRRHVDQAREDFRSALSATARSLTRLGDPAIGIAERREVLAELPEYRTRQRRILGTLDKLLDQVSGAQSERLHLVAELVGALGVVGTQHPGQAHHPGGAERAVRSEQFRNNLHSHDWLIRQAGLACGSLS
jgi:hypothetical protein